MARARLEGVLGGSRVRVEVDGDAVAGVGIDVRSEARVDIDELEGR